ncbi:hypothetical protein CERSUDRAFT_119252 [Gelatoporia subvermispora B]|uniref:Uncharacterized protein n=1 Tax=Ceriporiopsis subvermispora (strain B) TaxID=914234 RepID=M2R120_CERS8|nr:hypothetical protein CERSUDRAFT_119252 [Gelatoporia subvermispora B]
MMSPETCVHRYTHFLITARHSIPAIEPCTVELDVDIHRLYSSGPQQCRVTKKSATQTDGYICQGRAPGGDYQFHYRHLHKARTSNHLAHTYHFADTSASFIRTMDPKSEPTTLVRTSILRDVVDLCPSTSASTTTVPPATSWRSKGKAGAPVSNASSTKPQPKPTQPQPTQPQPTQTKPQPN